jgi:hypothetical protein
MASYFITWQTLTQTPQLMHFALKLFSSSAPGGRITPPTGISGNGSAASCFDADAVLFNNSNNPLPDMTAAPDITTDLSKSLRVISKTIPFLKYTPLL